LPGKEKERAGKKKEPHFQVGAEKEERTGTNRPKFSTWT
jgi:hypothetical protein